MQHAKPRSWPAVSRSPRMTRTPRSLEQLRAQVENEVTELMAAKSLSKVDKLWEAFQLPFADGTPKPTPKEREQQYQKFRETLSAEGVFDKFKAALKEAFAPLLDKGVLEKLPPEHDANKETISVHPVGTDTKFPRNVPGERSAH